MRLLLSFFAALLLSVSACTHTEPAKHEDQAQATKIITIQFCRTPRCNSVWKGMPYKIYAEDTLIMEGVVDETGYVYIEHKPGVRKYWARMANGTEYEMPVIDSSADPSQKTVSDGFREYEPGPPPPEGRTEPKGSSSERYRRLLHPEEGR
jgi:hypothetical protein